MNKISKNKLRLHRKKRIRAKISGTSTIPRLAVFRSLRSVSVQVIDDISGTTLVAGRLGETKEKNTVLGAEKLGQLVAEKCLQKNIESVVFDRSGYKYHGKIKSIAEGARKAGLKF